MSSEQFERAILEWYNSDRHKDLEYLNIAFPKPRLVPGILHFCYTESTYQHTLHTTQGQLNTIVDLIISSFNLLDLTFDKSSLFSKVALKNFKLILEKQEEQSKGIRLLETKILKIEKSINKNSRDLLSELDNHKSSTSKTLEEKALRLTEEVREQVRKVEALVRELHKFNLS